MALTTKKPKPAPKPEPQVKPKLKTYNIRIKDMQSIDVVEASAFGVSTSGALIFNGADGGASKAFNKDEWIEVWEVV